MIARPISSLRNRPGSTGCHRPRHSRSHCTMASLYAVEARDRLPDLLSGLAARPGHLEHRVRLAVDRGRPLERVGGHRERHREVRRIAVGPPRRCRARPPRRERPGLLAELRDGTLLDQDPARPVAVEPEVEVHAGAAREAAVDVAGRLAVERDREREVAERRTERGPSPDADEIVDRDGVDVAWHDARRRCCGHRVVRPAGAGRREDREEDRDEGREQDRDEHRARWHVCTLRIANPGRSPRPTSGASEPTNGSWSTTQHRRRCAAMVGSRSVVVDRGGLGLVHVRANHTRRCRKSRHPETVASPLRSIWCGSMTAGDVRHARPALFGLAGGDRVDAEHAAHGQMAEPRLGPWWIMRTLGRDLSGTYYAGRRDDGEQATLYVLSAERVAVGDHALARILEQHRELSHPGLLRFRSMDRDGSDCYLIADHVDGGLASLRGGRRPAISEARSFGAALADGLATCLLYTSPSPRDS